MIPFRADLHCHSTFSDGTDSPEQLILLAAELGLRGLSITDHDTIAFYEKENFQRQKSLFLLPGVEFSAMSRREPVHILAYGFSIDSESIKALCVRHQQRRHERNQRILKNLHNIGINLDLHDITHSLQGSWGRPHIAHELIKKGYVSSIQEAFELYLGEGKTAYDPGESVSVEETIEAIHQGRGKAVLAHPHLIKRSTTIRFLLELPFDGIECYYAKMAPMHEKKWLDIAHKKNWIITGGSDYHGKTKPYSELGSSWVGQETFDLLYNHFKSHSL